MKRMVKVGGKEFRITGRFLRIGQLEGDGYEFLDDPVQTIEALRESGSRIDLFTFMQRLPEVSPKYSYPMEWDNFAAVPITSFEEWWTRQIRPEARNRARQAAKRGVVVREVAFSETLVKGIREIYNECPVRQGRPFPHYGEDLQTVYDEEATFLDRSVFIGAFLEDRLIGFAKLTADETWTQANLMNILSMVAHRDKAPTNALIAHSVRLCAERGISYLVYQQFAYGKKGVDGIAKFKEVNGFRRFDLPRYFVPLTRRGAVAFRLGLHRRFVDNLPESLVSRVRDLRNTWYNRKCRTARGAA